MYCSPSNKSSHSSTPFPIHTLFRSTTPMSSYLKDSKLAYTCSITSSCMPRSTYNTWQAPPTPEITLSGQTNRKVNNDAITIPHHHSPLTLPSPGGLLQKWANIPHSAAVLSEKCHLIKFT